MLADAGVPMLAVEYPLMILALIPVIFIETWIVARSLKLPKGDSARAVISANLVSTFLGFPLAWGIMVGLEIATGGGGRYDLHTAFQAVITVTTQAPWFPPDNATLYWMIPTAAIILLVPSYFVSVWIEGLVMRALLPEEKRNAIFPVAWKANLASYAFLLLLGVAWLGWSIYSH